MKAFLLRMLGKLLIWLVAALLAWLEKIEGEDVR